MKTIAVVEAMLTRALQTAIPGARLGPTTQMMAAREDSTLTQQWVPRAL
jgi:hypothetical protein